MSRSALDGIQDNTIIVNRQIKTFFNLKEEIIRVVIEDGYAFPSEVAEKAQFCSIE